MARAIVAVCRPVKRQREVMQETQVDSNQNHRQMHHCMASHHYKITGLRYALLAVATAIIATTAAATERIDPLPPEQAFVFSAASDGQTVQVVYEMPEDIYMYRERFLLTVTTPGVRLAAPRFPPAVAYDDPFFGHTEIYYHSVTIQAQVSGQGHFTLQVVSQGCDKQIGICYPPQTHLAVLEADNTGGRTGDSADAAADAAAIIAEQRLPLTMAVFFGFGLLLSLTPCVLPMLPILWGVVGGGQGRRRSAILTAAYIGGVTATYTALGIAAGLSGQLLAPFLQQPPVLIASSLIFIVLALSMFGYYDIQPPAFLRRAGRLGGGGTIVGAAAMGVLSAAVVSPCVAAPLIGALIYIGNTGDAFTGGMALLSLSLGMSVLLACAGIGGGALLPRAGEWSDTIKKLLGLMLLGMAVWVSASLLPAPVLLAAYGALLIYGGVLLGAVSPVRNGGAAKLAQAVGIAVLLWGGAMILGAAAGGRDPLAPLSHLGAARQPAAPHFESVQSVGELQQQLTAAERPLMLDFYADWCISCKEMERFTFADPEVRRRLQSVLLLRADVTDNTAAHQKLLRRFGLYGPPAIIFFSADGKLLSGVRVSGYQSADEFLRTLDAAGV